MTTLVSELIARLRDGVSGPARTAGKSLDTLAQKGNRRGGFLAGINRGATEAAGSLGLLGGVAGGALLAKKGYTDGAAFDRQMTRIGITAEATAAQVAEARKQIFAVADDVGTGVGGVVEGLDALTAAGRSMPDAMSFLPAVARTAHASGAAISDMAASADALGTNLKVPADRMQEAFDILAAAGKAGKFELKDMAKELPALAAAGNAVGLSGIDGIRRLASYAQIVRKQTGSSGEAATNLLNVFQKMTSQETVNKFKKMGIKDLRGQLDSARKSGKDVMETFLDITEKATGGDLSKIPLLFNDAQMQAGMRALIGLRAEQRKLYNDLGNAGGTVARDLDRVNKDAQAGLDRLSNSFNQSMISLGGAMDKAGVTMALSSFTKDLSSFADEIDRIRDNIEKLGTVFGVLQSVKDSFHRTPEARLASDEKELAAGSATLTNDEAQRKYNAADAEVKRLEERYRGDPMTDTDARIYEQNKARRREAQATLDKDQQNWDRGRGQDLRDSIAKTKDEIFKAANPDYQEARPAGNMRKEDYRGVNRFGPDLPPPVQLPARPMSITPATAYPSAAPKVEASGADQAAQAVKGVGDQITALDGRSATVTVRPEGMAGVISDLDAIIAKIATINNSTVRTPSGGSGSGAYSDRGIGH
ncbi:phage tail tape measure protein [Labrys sp. (in: a-proteobacteria)]|uniref:phage tail tape measure protein n=1 Tax=Labrys sp. (in: a-proteobacteria) TaxID=1917972 RepID=UPI0039E71C82